MKAFVILGWPVAGFSHQLCTLRVLDFICNQQFPSLHPLTLLLFQRKSRPAVHWSRPCSPPRGPNPFHSCCIPVVSPCASVSFASTLHLSYICTFPSVKRETPGLIVNPPIRCFSVIVSVPKYFSFVAHTPTVSFLFLALEMWSLPFCHFIKSAPPWTRQISSYPNLIN